MSNELEIIRDLIKYMGISEEILYPEKYEDAVKENVIMLNSLSKELIETKKRSKETIIYRLAMTLYHSDRYWKGHVLKILDDPLNVYLKLISNTEFQEKYEEIWKKITNKKDSRVRAIFIKTLTCFLLAAFLYYSQLKE